MILPEIEVEESICVVAGDTVDILVTADDPDSNQLIVLTALGGPFEQNFSPSTFIVDSGYNEKPVTGRFIWPTKV